MPVILAIIRWVLGVFFALSFLVYFKTSPVTAVASLVLTAMLIPPLSKFVFAKISYTFSRKSLIVFGIVLFIVWVSAAPKTEVKGERIAVTPSPTHKVVVTNTPKPTNKPTNTPTPTAIPATPTPMPTIYYHPTPTPTIYIAPTASTPASTSTRGGSYSCDCSKTCTQISSCAEAQYQLNVCGCTRRDADHDGIACDGAPLNCQ